MAQFFRGQRVRSLSGEGLLPWVDEGVITEIIPSHYKDGGTGYRVLCDRHPCPRNINGWVHPVRAIAPLTDPSADRFIESIKRLGREPINDAPKVTVTK